MFTKKVTNMFSSYGKYFIFAFTLLSLLPVLIIKVNEFDAVLFWIYSLLTTSSLIFIYYFTYKYKSVEDQNHRPSVTVIVPCKNEEGVIAQTINAIINSNYPEDKLNVVVIDDGSNDNTYQIAKQFDSNRAKVIKHEVNKGKREAFATGFHSSDGEIVICIDSDTIIDKEAIRLLVQPFVDNKVVAVCGHGIAANKEKNLLTKIQHYWYQKMFIITKGMESKLGAVTCCSGILAAYRRENVHEIMNEWLNENFMGRRILFSDDRQLTNLSARGVCGIKTKDAKVVYQSTSIAYTMVPDNYRQFFKQQLRWKRGWFHGTKLASKFMWRKKALMVIYYYSSIILAILMPAIVIKWLIVAPLSGNLLPTIVYLMSLLYVAVLHGINTWYLSFNTKTEKSIKISELTDYILYTILFVPFSLVLAVLNIYAWSTCWKTGWLTRSNK